MAKILLVEDDRNLAENVAIFLTGQGHRVETAYSGAEATDLLNYNGYDLLIVDRGLPDIDGAELCRKASTTFCPPLVLILTGRKELTQVVNGLGAGADDYMGKPFSLLELNARVNALLRRASRQATGLLEFNGLALNKLSRQLTFEGREVSLFPRELDLLEVLLENQTTPLASTCLRRKANTEDLSHNALKTWISRLRKSLARLNSGLTITFSPNGYQLNYEQRNSSNAVADLAKPYSLPATSSLEKD